MDSDDELGLGDLMPREPSPPPPEATFSTYPLPEGYGMDELVIRLVGSHPLWGHHLRRTGRQSPYQLALGRGLQSANEIVICWRTAQWGSKGGWDKEVLTVRWNTALVTTSYILSHPSLSRNKRVLELGAGGGLPSLGCALAGGKTVLITDYADASLLENITYNVRSNLGESEEGRAVEVLGHTWGHDVGPLLECRSRVEREADSSSPNAATAPSATASADESTAAPAAQATPNFDLVILSDLMFNHSQHAALIRTLESTLRGTPVPEFVEGKTPCALVFFTHHRPHYAKEDMQFIADLRERGWQCDRVVEEYTGAMFENDPGDERVRGTVHGFRCWRSSRPQGEPKEAKEEGEVRGRAA